MHKRNGRKRQAHIIGWGSYVPEKVLDNFELEQMVDTSDEWIVERTGIRQRRIAADDQSTADLAEEAARKALEVADLDPSQLDLIIVASATPEYIFPATACIVQDRLGAKNSGAFDLSAACSGWIYGLSLASQAVATGAVDHVLVIGAETLSRFVDWEDRNTCVLFGDAAAAVVLGPSNQPGGVLSTVMGSDGSGAETLIIPAGGAKMPATLETVEAGMHTAKMDGRKVFRFATRVMKKASLEAMEKAGLEIEDISLVVPHQANIRIIEVAAKLLKIDQEQIYVNLDRYGNTSSASIPLALCEAIERDKVKPGDNLLLVGFGAGLTWAAAAVQWVTRPEPVSVWHRHRLSIFYLLARIRSALRRVWRAVETFLFRPPAPGA
ncbi:MAG: beta-ketoacyl-ACP synthase III [Chloroflexota bacterium]